MDNFLDHSLPDQPYDLTEVLANPLFRHGHYKNDTPHMLNDHAGQAWFQAFTVARIVQGSGTTAESPRYVGGRKDCAKPPKLKPVKIKASPGLTVETLQDVQHDLTEAFRDIQWEHNGRHYKLHPFAITTWANVFTTEAFGTSGLAKINNILMAAAAGNRDGLAPCDIVRASRLSTNSDLTEVERTFYSVFTTVIANDLNKGNAWFAFMAMRDICALITSFNAMCDAVRADYNGDTANSLRQRCDSHTLKKGRQLPGQIAEICAQDLGWTPKNFNAAIEKYRGVSMCLEKLGEGFLLLVNGDTMSA